MSSVGLPMGSWSANFPAVTENIPLLLQQQQLRAQTDTVSDSVITEFEGEQVCQNEKLLHTQCDTNNFKSLKRSEV